MLEYRVIWSDTISDLVRRVNDHVSDNWVPIGGVCGVFRRTDATFGDIFQYLQAMTREKEPEYVEFENGDKFGRSTGTASRVKLTGDEHPWMDKGE